MTQKIPIALSDRELELVCNTDWILMKRVIIEKVYRLFGSLALSMQLQIHKTGTILSQQATEGNPKISRGENYRGLPYVMLDYPRHFTRESTLAIRTLFWWGNFFSINLHVSGSCKEMILPSLKANFETLQLKGFSVCVHSNPWARASLEWAGWGSCMSRSRSSRAGRWRSR